MAGKLKSCASHFECDAHDLVGLGIEFGTVQKLRDGHDPSPTIGKELYAILRVNQLTDYERIDHQQKSERAGPHAMSGRRALQRLAQCRVSSRQASWFGPDASVGPTRGYD